MVSPSPCCAGSNLVVYTGVGLIAQGRLTGNYCVVAAGVVTLAVGVATMPLAAYVGYNIYNTGYKNPTCIENAPGAHVTTLTKASTVLGKDGNIIFASPGPDNFFFSMCSTKKGATIMNFDPTQDRVFIFCTKQTIVDPQIHYDEDTNFTHIVVNTAHTITDIDIEGEYKGINPILNTKFGSFCNGETKYWSAEDNAG